MTSIFGNSLEADLQFNYLSEMLSEYLKRRDFIETSPGVLSSKVCDGNLVLSVRMDKVKRKAVAKAEYSNSRYNGEPEVLESDDFDEVINFVREFK